LIRTPGSFFQLNPSFDVALRISEALMLKYVATVQL